MDAEKVVEHEGGRNAVYVLSQNGRKESVLRFSACGDRAGEEVDYEDIGDAADCLIRSIPYAGMFEEN